MDPSRLEYLLTEVIKQPSVGKYLSNHPHELWSVVDCCSYKINGQGIYIVSEGWSKEHVFRVMRLLSFDEFYFAYLYEYILNFADYEDLSEELEQRFGSYVDLHLVMNIEYSHWCEGEGRTTFEKHYHRIKKLLKKYKFQKHLERLYDIKDEDELDKFVNETLI